jgi:hypothetical protein
VEGYMSKNKAAVDEDIRKEREEAEAKKKVKQAMRGAAGAKGGYRSTTASQKAFLEENEEYRKFQDVKSINLDLTLERTLPIHRVPSQSPFLIYFLIKRLWKTTKN